MRIKNKLSKYNNMTMKLENLRGKTVLITGGAQGIGAALVEAFLHNECNVFFIDLDTKSSASLLKKHKSSKNLTWINVDLTNEKALKKQLNKLKIVDILINNAANDLRHKTEQLSIGEWHQLLDANLTHYFICSQIISKQMKKRRSGVIINVGSISWRLGDTGMLAYTTSKAAIEGFTKSLARELGAYAIRVHCVALGWIMTEKQLRLWVDSAAKDRIKSRQCLPQPIQPNDVTGLFLFLGSDHSLAMTKQTLIIDGGWS